MKMTSSLLIIAVVCWASLVAGQTTPRPALCSVLTDPADGSVVVTSQTEGGVATFSCNPGFDLVGEPSLTCTAGSWSGVPPTCTATAGASSAPDMATNAAAVAANSPPSGSGTTAAPAARTTRAAMGDATSMAAKTGDGDMDGHKGHDDDDDDEKQGLRADQIALAVLATLLTVATLAVFIGLCYWKHKGTSYVTVTADTTYRQ